MKAITPTTFGCADVLKLVEHKQPIIGQNEVLIRVQAAGINRADIAKEKEITLLQMMPLLIF